MTDLLVDPRFWGAISGALFVAFFIIILVAALSPWPRRPHLFRRKGHPEVVGAIRPRCEICGEARAEPGQRHCGTCERFERWREADIQETEWGGE